MTDLRVNAGLYFFHPFESYYAITRRCLLANPSLNYNSLSKILLVRQPNRYFAFKRIANLTPHLAAHPSLLPIHQSLKCRRQCPECAKHFYHSEFFEFDWLTKCPIHGIELVDKCPVCNKPWPHIHNIHHTQCAACGLPAVLGIDKLAISNDKTSYKNIKRIKNLVKKDTLVEGQMYLRYPSRLQMPYWWLKVPTTAESYPSFLLTRANNYSRRKLESLCIKAVNIHCQRSRLTPLKERHQMFSNNWPERRWEKDQHSSLTISEKIISEYKVTNRIVHWIQSHFNEHQIIIQNYHNDYMLQHDEKSRPCPFCMAFSLWFFHLACSHYERGEHDPTGNYAICHRFEFKSFFSIGEPAIKYRDEFYGLDLEFVKWFYPRSLEILFVDLMRFSMAACNNIDNTELWRRQLLKQFSRIFSDRFYASDIRNQTFHFYYEHEHPLDHIELQKPNFSSVNCGLSIDLFMQHQWREGFIRNLENPPSLQEYCSLLLRYGSIHANAGSHWLFNSTDFALKVREFAKALREKKCKTDNFVE